MKKVLLSIVGSMLIGLSAVHAQQDESATKMKDQQQKDKNRQSRQMDRNRDNAWTHQGDRNRYANEGMVEIQKEQIPSSLKETLQDEKYAGWENATIYHNTNTGEYLIAPRAYRFDDKGKEIEIGDNNAYGSRRYDRQSDGDRSDRNQMDKRSRSRDRHQMDQTPSSQQSGNDQATGQSESYDQSSDRTRPSSGYRSGQDAAGDRTDQSQSDRSTTDGATSGDQSQSSSSNRQDQ